MKEFQAGITPSVSDQYPGSYMAFLAVQCPENPALVESFQDRKQELVKALQLRYPDKASLNQAPVIQAYQQYYQRFKANYHVRFQIESVVFKGKPLPTHTLLVDAMFMTEVKHGVLIAGHDLKEVKFPLVLDCTQEEEQYPLLSGEIKQVKSGDLCLRDQEKILSTILYGPELTSPIHLQTRQALYTIYGPPGVSSECLTAALEELKQLLHTGLSDFQVLWSEILTVK